MNGDFFFDADMKRLVTFHHNRKTHASIALWPMAKTRRYGRVVVNDHCDVVAFDEKQGDTYVRYQ
jgi:NDP-sugar pyrophosphorylase family protein